MENPATNGLVVVTGAGGGIGEALVRAFAAQGSSVIGVYKDGLQRLPDGSIEREQADLSSPEEVTVLAKRLQKKAPIRWLVHCAGIIAPAGTDESLDASFAVNAFAPIELSLALKDSLEASGGIVFISSTAGIWGSPQSPLYSASKSALHGFAFALQKLLKPGQKSIVVAPGPTNTPMRESIASDAASHQGPDTVAARIIEILSMEDERAQRLFVVRNGAIEKIAIETIV